MDRRILSFAALAVLSLPCAAMAATQAAAASTTVIVAKTIANPDSTYFSDAGLPPGVTAWNAAEVGKQMTVWPATVAALYPAQLPKDQAGQLIVLMSDNHLSGVVQAVSGGFKLRRGERVIVVRSQINGWVRVLPYDGLLPKQGH